MNNRKKYLCALFTVLMSMSLIVAFSFARAAGRGNYKTLSYKTLPSEEEIIALSAYDGRDYGIITPVKDQGSTNLCWAYSSVAASEASIVRSGLKKLEEVNLNPTAAAYRVNNRGEDPLRNTSGEYVSGDFTSFAGNPSKIATIFSGWWGPVSGTNANVDPFVNSDFRLENAVHIPENKDNTSLRISEIKKAIAKYGAVTFQYNNLHNNYYYNPKNEKNGSSYPHACTIIGWDDNIPAESFNPHGATMNGGWLIKNSYASLPDGYPYFYISYDNTSSSMYAFSYVEKETYDRNYYYDGAINDFPLRNDKHVANVYRAGSEVSGKTEKITAVNVGVEGNDYTLEVEIYTGLSSPFEAENTPVDGGRSAAKKTARFDYGGYVTVRLDEPVTLSAGEWFSVIVRVSEGTAKIRLGVKNGKDLSYAGSYGSYAKFGNFVGRIKAFTTFFDSSSESSSESSSYSDSSSDSSSESSSEHGSDKTDQSESEDYSQTESESVTESETGSESESETETGTESESESEAETGTESESETESETETGTESESESETETGTESETETETKTETETGSSASSGSESDSTTSESEDKSESMSSGNKESEDYISSDDKDDGGSLSSAGEGITDKNNESCMSAISAGTILFNAGIIIAAICLFFKRHRQ